MAGGLVVLPLPAFLCSLKLVQEGTPRQCQGWPVKALSMDVAVSGQHLCLLPAAGGPLGHPPPTAVGASVLQTPWVGALRARVSVLPPAT